MGRHPPLIAVGSGRHGRPLPPRPRRRAVTRLLCGCCWVARLCHTFFVILSSFCDFFLSLFLSCDFFLFFLFCDFFLFSCFVIFGAFLVILSFVFPCFVILWRFLVLLFFPLSHLHYFSFRYFQISVRSFRYFQLH